MTSDIDDLTECIEHDPSDAWLYWERACLYRDAREYKLAIADFSEAIALEPDEPVFWRSRGLLYERRGEVGRSQVDLDRAVELDPEDARSYDARGWCYKLNHDADAARADFDRAIELEPLKPEYRRRRALVWLDKDELGKALDDFDEAIRLDPEEPQYFYERAWALLYKNPAVQPEQALPDLEEAIRLRPDADWFRMERGYIRCWQGRWAEAAEDFARQDFRSLYEDYPRLGAPWAIWIGLARHLEGRSALCIESVREYLDWYLNESEGYSKDQTRAEKLETWPIPLVRFLAGDIDARELIARKDLDATDPGLGPWELGCTLDRISECDFVFAALALAQGLPDEAEAHFRKARGMPLRNPMSWIVVRQLDR